MERSYLIIVPQTENGDRVPIEITPVRENVAFTDVIECEPFQKRSLQFYDWATIAFAAIVATKKVRLSSSFDIGISSRLIRNESFSESDPTRLPVRGGTCSDEFSNITIATLFFESFYLRFVLI